MNRENKSKHILSLIFLALSSIMVFGQEANKAYVEELDKGAFINKYALVFKTEKDLSVEEVLFEIENALISVAESNISPGISDSFYWIQLDLYVNHNSLSPNQYLLELDNPHIDKFIVYQKNLLNTIPVARGGDHYPYNNRVYEGNSFVVPLTLEVGKNTLLIKIDKRNSSVRFPLKLWNEANYKFNQQLSQRHYGLFFGFLLLVIITSFSIGYLIKSELFAVYGMYVLLVFLFVFTSSGYSFKYIYPNNTFINDYLRLILTVINLIVVSYYIVLFLNLSKHRPNNLKPIKWSGGFTAILILVWLFFPLWVRANGSVFLNLILLQVAFVSIILTVSAIQVYRYEKGNVIIFFLSFSFQILGALVFVLLEKGVVVPGVFSVDPVSAGVGLEVLTLSVAMGFRYKKTRALNEQLQRKNKKLMLENTRLFKSSIITSKSLLLDNKHEIDFSDIIYIKSDGHYLKLYTNHTEVPRLERLSLKAILLELPRSRFVQIHKSYIVNVDFIKIKYATKLFLKDNTELPVSRTFKKEMEKITLQS